MKILYVEDKPSENIDRIINLFRKYLSKNIVKQLENMNEDESGRGATPEEIKQVINSSGSIWFEYNFSDTLKVLNKNQNEFVLYIIDRNLSDSEYVAEEIRKFEPNYSEDLSTQFLEREGDYLLEKLLYENVDVMNKFYFLTANSKDNLRNIEEIQKHIDFGKFSSDNFIDKTDKEKLRNIINSHKQMQIQLENSEYIEILQKYVGDYAVDEFINLLLADDLKINHALISLRILLENILRILAKKKNPPMQCWNNYERKYSTDSDDIALSKFISEITRNNPLKYNTNIFIDNALRNIKEATNVDGAHLDLRAEPGATRNTVQSLIHNLKDIITWFGDILE